MRENVTVPRKARFETNKAEPKNGQAAVAAVPVDRCTRSLVAQDPVRNLGAAIASGEAAWEILRVLAPGEIHQETLARLGAYCRPKGDAVGPPGNRGWYEKSVAVLECAREASLAIEKVYGQAQPAHGKPLATRLAYLPVYADLALAYMRLGRYADAVEVLRYGREVHPWMPALYDLPAAAYTAQGELAARGRYAAGKDFASGRYS